LKNLSRFLGENPVNESQANMHEYVLIYPNGESKPQGKKVPLTKHNQGEYTSLQALSIFNKFV
jgi:hypothetical protein